MHDLAPVLAALDQLRHRIAAHPTPAEVSDARHLARNAVASFKTRREEILTWTQAVTQEVNQHNWNQQSAAQLQQYRDHLQVASQQMSRLKKETLPPVKKYLDVLKQQDTHDPEMHDEFVHIKVDPFCTRLRELLAALKAYVPKRIEANRQAYLARVEAELARLKQEKKHDDAGWHDLVTWSQRLGV
jgi:hypothetical protein